MGAYRFEAAASLLAAIKTRSAKKYTQKIPSEKGYTSGVFYHSYPYKSNNSIFPSAPSALCPNGAAFACDLLCDTKNRLLHQIFVLLKQISAIPQTLISDLFILSVYFRCLVPVHEIFAQKYLFFGKEDRRRHGKDRYHPVKHQILYII